MKFFPSKERHFRLISSQEETIERLKRRTDKTNKLTAWHKQQSFRGRVRRNKFELNLSQFAGGVVVLNGVIEEKNGTVTIGLQTGLKTMLKIFFAALFLLPFIAAFFVKDSSFLFLIIPVLIQVSLFYLFITIVYKVITNRALRRLQDVLDIEWIEKLEK